MPKLYPVVGAPNSDACNNMRTALEEGREEVLLYRAQDLEAKVFGLDDVTFKAILRESKTWIVVFAKKGEDLLYVGNVADRGGKVHFEVDHAYFFSDNVFSKIPAGGNITGWIHNLRVNHLGFFWLECSNTRKDPTIIEPEVIPTQVREDQNVEQPKIKEVLKGASTKQIAGATMASGAICVTSLVTTVAGLAALVAKIGVNGYHASKPVLKTGARGSGKALSGLGRFLQRLGQ